MTGRARQLDVLAGPDPGVGPLAVDLDRRDRGRDLLEVADEGASAARERLVGEVRGAVTGQTSPSASSVVVAAPEPDRGVVGLVGQRQVPEQPGRAVDAEQQHPGGHRVERAGVADLAGAGQPAHPGDHVVRGHPGGLSTTTRPASIGIGHVTVGLVAAAPSRSSSSVFGFL